jgi:hypothetical protein
VLDEQNYYPLKIRCYICNKYGHICMKCPYYNKRKGNLVKTYNKIMKKKQSKAKMKSSKRNNKRDRKSRSISLSYIYEEDDPRRAPHKFLGNLEKDK